GEICPAFAKLVSSAGPGSRSTTVTSKPARDRYHALLTPITPPPRTSTCIAYRPSPAATTPPPPGEGARRAGEGTFERRGTGSHMVFLFARPNPHTALRTKEKAAFRPFSRREKEERSLGVIELGHRFELLALAPLVRARTRVDDLAANDGVQHPRAQDVIRRHRQKVAGKHVDVGQLAGRERAQLVILENRIGVVPGVGLQFLHRRLGLGREERLPAMVVRAGDAAIEHRDGVGVLDRRVGAVQNDRAAVDQLLPDIRALFRALLAEPRYHHGRIGTGMDGL